ncbi:MAG: CCA tRNA nucleotidyltransferase [Bacillota bacterium]
MASALMSAPGRAYLVGGPVRDLLLGLEPKDWDIATDLTPEQVLSAFPNAVTVGIEFGRVQVSGIDVVSLRAESGYEDGRHPSSVLFGVPVEEDLRRRDFTVNAMAAEFPGLKVIDPFGGAGDLSARILRSVGDPRDRLEEDPLRMLRAIRFKTMLGMNMHPSLAGVLPQTAHLLSRVSGTRTFAELRRILLAPGVYQGILDLAAYGLGPVVLPEVFSSGASEEGTARALAASPPDLVTRCALLFRSRGAEAANAAFERFGAESSLRKDVRWVLTRALARESAGSEDSGDLSRLAYEARKLILDGGLENVQRLVDFEQAVWRSRGREGVPARTAELALGIQLAGDSGSEPLALSGDDVKQATGAGGRQVGEALAYLQDLVLRDPAANTKAFLMSALREWWEKR